MNTWNQSINPAVEGVRFDQLKERLKSKFGLNEKANIETLSKNMKTIVTVSQMRTLNNSVINDYCDELDKANQTSATVSEMAKAYLIDKAYKNKQVYMLSVMAGVDYSNIAPKTNRYTTLMSKVTISEEATVSNQRDAERRLKDLSTLIDLGTKALSTVTDIYAQTKNPSKTSLNCQINYETILKKHSTLMHDGAQVTQESTNDGPKLLLEDMVKTTLIKHDPALLNKTKQLIPPANKLLAQSKLVDKTSDVIWKEWEQVNKTQVEIANLYSKLRDRKPSPNIEGRTHMPNWNNSLEPATESGGFSKIKSDVAKFFGVGDRERVEALRKAAGVKINTGSLSSIKDPIIGQVYRDYLTSQKKDTTTVANMNSFYMSTLILKQNLEKALTVASGHSYVPLLKNLPTLMAKTTSLVESPTDNNFTTTIGKFNTLISDMEKTYATINKGLEIQKPMKATSVKQGVVFKDILEHHQTMLQLYWENNPDGAFALKHKLSTLKGEVGRDSTNNQKLVELSSRLDAVIELIKKTAGYMGVIASEWGVLNKGEIKIANIYDSISLSKPSDSTESKNWELAFGVEANETTWGNIKKKVYDAYLKKTGKKGLETFRQLEEVVATDVGVGGLATLKEAKLFKPLHDKLVAEGKKTVSFHEVAKFYMVENCVNKGLINSLNALCGVDISNDVWPLFDIEQSTFEVWEEPISKVTVKRLLSLSEEYYQVVTTAHTSLKQKHSFTKKDVRSESTYATPLKHTGMIWGALDRFREDTLNEIVWALGDKTEETSTTSKDNVLLTSAIDKLKPLKNQVKDLLKYDDIYWKEEIELSNIENNLVKIFNTLAGMKTGTEANQWELSLGIESDVPDEEKKDMGEVSDGDHTFNELYYHRTTLFNIILCQNKDKAWKSKLHDDGTMFDDYFIAGIETPEGNFTYHQHLDFWDKFDVVEREKAPVWDGHKSSDITRLYSLL